MMCLCRLTYLVLNKIALTALSTTRYVLLCCSVSADCFSFSQIGACRHGDRCSRKHIRPPFSQTILLPNVYHNPAHDPVCKLTEKELQEGFDAVYEDLYCELAKFGHLLELHVSRMLALQFIPCHSVAKNRYVTMLETT